MASIAQQFFFVVSTVSAKNAWHIDPPLCPKYEKKVSQITSLASYRLTNNARFYMQGNKNEEVKILAVNAGVVSGR